MGHFAGFNCSFCHYSEPELGVGGGRAEFPLLKLFRCDSYKPIGSAWIYPDKLPHCSHCYHGAVTILDDDASSVSCPRCGEPGITRKECGWG